MSKNELSTNIDKEIETCFNFNYLRSSQNKKNRKLLSDIIDECKDDGSLYHHPKDIFLKITSQCNLRCKHCFYYANQNEFSSANDFSTDELMELAEYLVEEINAINFTITGGEPFLQKDVLKILKYLKSKNVTLYVLTNGTLITEEMATELGKIFNPKTDSFQISLEGTSAKVHDEVRGEGSFKKTIEGIKNLTNNKINVSISYTATSVNTYEIPDLYELCKNLKVRRISLNKFQVCSEEQAYLEPKLESLFVAVSRLIEVAKDERYIDIKASILKPFDFLMYEKGRNLVEQYLSTNKISLAGDLMCHRHDKVSICADGRVCLCTQAETEELCLGNLKDKSFLEIWENRFNNVFFQGRFLEKSACRKCKYVNFCTTGCAAAAYCKYGDVNAPDGDCPIGKELVEQYPKRESNLC